MLWPTISLPPIWSHPTIVLHVSGGGQHLTTIAPSWPQQTSWWVCQITHETTECFCRYFPLVFINCYGNSTPVERTIVAVWDIVTPVMHCEVRFHLVLHIYDWTVHRCQLSWCSKQSKLILELLATISGAVIRRCTETAQWIWKTTSVNSTRPDLGPSNIDTSGHLLVIFYFWPKVEMYWLCHGTWAISNI